MRREREGGNRYLCDICASVRKRNRKRCPSQVVSHGASLATIDKIGAESILNNYESCIKDSRRMK